MVASAKALRVSDQQRVELERLARSVTAPVREVRQAKVLLAAAGGVANAEIGRRHEVSLPTVRRWPSRFTTEGVASIGRVRPGRGRPPGDQ